MWAWFADGLEPLKEAGQLGSILLQYPRWFFTSSENRDEIEGAVERLRAVGLTGSIEFRNATWFNEKNLEHHALPRRPSDPDRHGRRSAGLQVERADRRDDFPDLALIRFHGRRTETWEKQNIKTVERFRYLYDDDDEDGRKPRCARRPRAVEGHACPVQQLLRQLRRDERDRVRPDAPRPGGRRAGLTVRFRFGKTAPDDPPLSCPMAESHSVPGFRPSDDGLHFQGQLPVRTDDPPRPAGSAHHRHRGRLERVVRRMSFFVRRRFATGGPVPAMTTVPDNGSDLFQQLVREQVRSLRLGVVPMRFWRLASMNAADRAARTRDREWPHQAGPGRQQADGRSA